MNKRRELRSALFARGLVEHAFGFTVYSSGTTLLPENRFRMTLLTDISTADWMTLGPRLAGTTFVWAGAIKAIAPHTFRNHLASLGWIPRRGLSAAVTAAAGVEVGWGLALVTGLAPAVVYPVTLLLLVVLTSISWWGVHTGKARDCGCYGGYIQPSIGQSVGLNGAFALLVIAAWILGFPSMEVPLWKAAVAIAGGATAAGLADYAQRFLLRTGNLRFDISPLKLGNRWRHSWAGDVTARLEGEMLVAFLGQNCPHCSHFVKIANAMVQSPALPRVVGVMSATDAEVREYCEKLDIRFPVATVSESLMARLTRAVPTAVIVNSGTIQDMWIGSIPPRIVDRFRDAFFPDVAEQAPRSAIVL